MKDNFLITIKGTMEQGKDTDSVEMMTRGSLVHKDKAYYIVYAESEATGYAGCTTTLRVQDDAKMVTMTRFGQNPSSLYIEKGIRHLCHYETGFGAMSLGVSADEIEHRLSEDGGSVHFSYTLDTGAEEFISRNSVNVTVRPVQ